MLDILLTWLRQRRSAKRRTPARRPKPYIPLRLEWLEDRELRAVDVFTGVGNWSNGALWSLVAPPTAADDVVIAAGSQCTLTTGNQTVLSLTVAGLLNLDNLTSINVTPGGGPSDPGAPPAGSTVIGPGGTAGLLTLLYGSDLYTNSLTATTGGGAGGLALNDYGFIDTATMVSAAVALANIQSGGVLQIDTSATFSGSVIDTGLINANTTSINGTPVTFFGGTAIGPGDLNGNLAAGPNSSFTFASSGFIGNTLNPGATFGMGAGSVIVAAPVTVAGTFTDGTMPFSVVTGGALGGPGSVVVDTNFNWTGGTLSVAGGIDNQGPGDFNIGGAAPLALDTLLTNSTGIVNLGGVGLALGTAGGISNGLGAYLNITVPAITTGTTALGITNVAGGLLYGLAPASDPTLITGVPFTNNGYLIVPSGDALILQAPTAGGPPGGPAVDLDGVLQLSGNLTLEGAVSAPTGFVEDAAPGFLLVGNPSSNTTGTLTLGSGETTNLFGNLEVTSMGTLTGGGQVFDSGRLQLDAGSSTLGLGAYQQASDGNLALDVATIEGTQYIPSPLTVTDTAQLSGTLILMDYTPVVGDSFPVVKAGSLSDEFDTLPDGMDQSETSTTATVTQVRPPA